MTMRLETAAGILVLALFGCQQAASRTATLETDDQKASYAIGLNVGQGLVEVGSHMDLAALSAGIEDALAKNQPRLAQPEIEKVMSAFMQVVQAERDSSMAAASQRNTEEGQAYLAENGARPAVTTTESGLQYEVLQQGDGPRPGPDDQVTVHYRGTLIDGTEFDSSYSRSAPQSFSVSGVVRGFSEGLQLMSVGSKYRFVIPSDLAYGPAGRSELIGPNATLIFEVELISIP